MGECEEFISAGENGPDQGFGHTQEFCQLALGGVNSVHYTGVFMYTARRGLPPW